MLSSFERCEINVSLMQPTPNECYSASVVDWAVEFCCLGFQSTALPMVMTSPLVDI